MLSSEYFFFLDADFLLGNDRFGVRIDFIDNDFSVVVLRYYMEENDGKRLQKISRGCCLLSYLFAPHPSSSSVIYSKKINTRII